MIGANVFVYSDNIFVAGTASDLDGNFEIEAEFDVPIKPLTIRHGISAFEEIKGEVGIQGLRLLFNGLTKHMNETTPDELKKDQGQTVKA